MTERLHPPTRPPLLPGGRLSLSEAQVVQRSWEDALLGDQGRRVSSRIKKFMDEAIELGSLMTGVTDSEFDKKLSGNELLRKAVAFEAIDTIIVALSVIDGLGMDAEQLFSEKMMLNYQKYSIKRRTELIEQGLSPAEAMAIMKQEWQAMFDRDEFGNHKIK